MYTIEEIYDTLQGVLVKEAQVPYGMEFAGKVNIRTQ